MATGTIALFLLCLVVGGGGKRFFPDGVGLNLKPIEERRFPEGGLVLPYAIRSRTRLVSVKGVERRGVRNG